MNPKKSVRRSLIIGVNNYSPSIGALSYCNSDAIKIEKALNTRRDGFNATESTLLIDQENQLSPTRSNIIENVVRLCNTATDEDTLVIYFSGHGEIGGDENFYLLPVDSRSAALEETSVSWKWIQEKLSKTKAKSKILFLDACHSGAGRETAAAVRKSYKIADKIKSAEDYVCLSSCSGGELSYASKKLEQGIFSYYLAQGILGAADPSRQGIINVENLYDFARDRTVRYAKQIGLDQHPFLIAKVPFNISSYTISAASIDRPINSVLIVTEDHFIGCVMSAAVHGTALSRGVTCVNDVKNALIDARDRFDHDAVYIEVENEWEVKKSFIDYIRNKYPIVPFVLIGNRLRFLNSLSSEERTRFSNYFFFDINTPLSEVPENALDTLGMVEWDIGTRYGAATDY